jgi:hypothetical protein
MVAVLPVISWIEGCGAAAGRVLPVAGEPVGNGRGVHVRVEPGGERCIGKPGAEASSLAITYDFTWVVVEGQDDANQVREADGGRAGDLDDPVVERTIVYG